VHSHGCTAAQPWVPPLHTPHGAHHTARSRLCTHGGAPNDWSPTAVRCAAQVFIGDQSVGKTSIISRFMYDQFDTHYASTIGAPTIGMHSACVCVLEVPAVVAA